MPLGVGVIGAGTVGGGVIAALQTHAAEIRDKAGVEVELRHVADKNEAALREHDLEGIAVSGDAFALINDPQVDVVCELIGGEEPARKFILGALEAGKHVVTANKMLLAKHGPQLNEAALKSGRSLRYEAAVGGVIPIIKTVRESLASNRIGAIYGILNGTCNYILTRMTYEGLPFDDVLRQAQEAGYAETPPDLDILGHDTAHKCQILASLAHGTQVDLTQIPVEGITNVAQIDVQNAREMGYVIKLLAVVALREGELEARVYPSLVKETHLLAAVRNAYNAVYVESDIAGPTLYYGAGAGRMPTASAVIADIVDIARNCDAPAGAPFRYPRHVPLRDPGAHIGRYYLRLTAADHPGVLGRICTILGEHRVNIASLHQKEESEDLPAHIIVVTDATLERNIMSALAEIDALDFIKEPTRLLRVL